MNFIEAPDLKARVVWVAKSLEMGHVILENVACFRSTGSKSRAYARIWALPRIFQKAMATKAHYAIEFLESFERVSEQEKDKIIIHELLHIPKTFSGGLRPHNCFGKKMDKEVEILHKKLRK